MENRKLVKSFLSFFIFAIILSPFFVSAYSEKTTHPALTNEAVDLFNHYSSKHKLTAKERGLLKKGSIEEDMGMRPLNHFYDPVYKKGLLWHLSSVEWSQSAFAQAGIKEGLLGVVIVPHFEHTADYSWERAIFDYVYNDKERALVALGHVVHLIQDASVPDHTRGDKHPPFFNLGSPYEGWTSKFNEENFHLAKELIENKAKPILYDNLDQYFYNLAEYSNSNFFSKDTTPDKSDKYLGPVVAFEQKQVLSSGGIYRFGYSGKGVKLALIRKEVDAKEGKINITYEIKDTDNLIVSDYWSLLSREAVLHGAGVIELFFKEVEKEKQTFALLNKNKSPLGKGLSAVGTFAKAGVINGYYSVVVPSAQFAKKTYKSTKTFVVNTAVKTKDAAKNTYNKTKSFASKTLSGAASAIKYISSKILEVSPAAIFSNKKINTTQPLTFPIDSNINMGNIAGALQPGANSEVLSVFDEPGASNAGLFSANLLSSTLNDVDLDEEELSIGQSDDVVSLYSQPSSVGQLFGNNQGEEGELVETGEVEEVIFEEEVEVLLENDTEDKKEEKEEEKYEGKDKKEKGSGISLGSSIFSGYGGGLPSGGNPGDSDEPEKPEKPEEPADTIAPDAPLVTSPDSFLETSTSTEIAFSGTAEALSLLSVDFDTATTTVDSDGNWSLSLSLGQGSTTIQFFATDEADNTSDPTEISLFVDSQSPDTSIFALECQNSISSSGCVVIVTTLNVIWSSAAVDLDYFEFTDDSGVSTTTATSTIVSVTNGSTNTFSVRAKDKTGLWSDLVTIIVDIDTTPVVINEVAWAGTAAESQDEWIELYNKTGSDIELDDWVLYSEKDMKPYIKLKGTIPAKGYYLIERTDDETVSDIAADLATPFGSGKGFGLTNVGEVLVLNKASTTVDRTGVFGSVSWPGGAISRNRSMERINPDFDGEDPASWGSHMYSAVIRNGEDADGDLLRGTPKARNSLNYLIANGDQIVRENVTLTEDIYLVDKTTQIFSGATLEIGKGTVIKFRRGTGFNFKNGAKLLAQGVSGSPVIFTSIYDDEYGGDLNGDATSTIPAPGDWSAVGIFSDGSAMDNVIFRYGGKEGPPGSAMYAANVFVQNASAQIDNSVFEYSRSYGLALYNSTSTVTGSIIRYNNSGNDTAGINSAIRIGGGSPLLQNNTISNNNNIGISLYNSAANIINNTFSSNNGKAIYSSAAVGNFFNNKGSGNGINGIVLQGVITVANETTTLGVNELPYVIIVQGANVATNSTLIIPSGVVVKSNVALMVQGDLVISGDNPGDVVFTSLHDDSIAGDTTNNGDATSPKGGQAAGINVRNGGSISAEGLTVRYGGSTGYGGSNSAGIIIDGGVANISDTLFDSNYSHGLFVLNSDITILNTQFNNHEGRGSWGTKAAFYVANATATLTNVSFDNNLIGIQGGMGNTFIVDNVQFTNTAATTSPLGLW